MNQTPPIATRAYFDAEVFEQEKALLFATAPHYVGATTMLGRDGDAVPVERLGDSKFLLRSKGAVRLFDNVCTHRQAKLLCGPTHGTVTCPFHRWTYDADGRCLRRLPEGHTARPLTQTPLTEWKGLLFAGGEALVRDLQACPTLHEVGLESLEFSKSSSSVLPYNWKHVVEVFSENDHIPFIHPGFSAFVDVRKLEWHEYERFHTQTFITARDVHGTPTPAYADWFNELRAHLDGRLPHIAGVNVLAYPNVLLEVYPLYAVLTTLTPLSATSTRCHTDVFHDRRASPALRRAAEAACDETMTEDAELCLRLAEGRRFLYEQGRDEHGPVTTPLEAGVPMFRRYYHRAMFDSGAPRCTVATSPG